MEEAPQADVSENNFPSLRAWHAAQQALQAALMPVTVDCRIMHAALILNPQIHMQV
jgi:hypothetical protein